MLSCGMKETKMNYLIIGFFVLLLLFFLLFGIIFVKYRNKRYLDSNDYYEKMLLLSETSSELEMKEVFSFEFDKAYVANEPYGDEKYFLKKLDVDTAINIPTLETGAHSRILFIKDNRIIYDFVYEMGKISISEVGIWVYPSSIMRLKHQKFNESSESIIGIEILKSNSES